MARRIGARLHGLVAIAVADRPDTVPTLGTRRGRVAVIGLGRRN